VIDDDALSECAALMRALSQRPERFFGPERQRLQALRAEASRLVAAIQGENHNRRQLDRDRQRDEQAKRNAERQHESGAAEIRCYVCHRRVRAHHVFYEALCPVCGELSYQKRDQRADLREHHALVTGGRIKIGYHCALKLLRAGARVSVTTRFVCDASRRFAAEEDVASWRARLRIYGLDLRDLGATQRLADVLVHQNAPLSIVINNAAQTVRRPAAYYRPLLEGEDTARLPTALGTWVDSEMLHDPRTALLGRGGHFPAQLTQFPLLAENHHDRRELFPRPDDRNDPVDLRDATSWTQVVGEIDPLELIETHLVGAFAPFVLLQRLLPLLREAPVSHRHVINVTAAEGIFELRHKPRQHPHTNMAKAALNMLTRTSAPQLAEQRIYLNSVDPGWVSVNQPLSSSKPPLDMIDGAARVLDPIFSAERRRDNGEALPVGQLLRHFKPHPW
jgi:NAD(P)-dependent dehydrogenase (short-subunit alcohol dehydrogenase family)